MADKPKIAILTLHPENHGGILSSLRTVYKFCSKYFAPTVFFLGFDSEISVGLRSIRRRFSVRHRHYFGMPCVEIGAKWAFWEPGHYSATLDCWRRELEGFDYFFVTSGTSIAAHPLVMLGKQFVLWTATPYDDDRLDRRAKMPLSRRFVELVSAPFMRRIEKQVLRNAGSILPMSCYARERFAQMSGIDSDHMSVCGYPQKLFECDGERDRKIAVAVGRFSDPRKNAAMLFRTWDRVVSMEPDAKLILVGEQPDSGLMCQYNHLITSGAVKCLGFVEESEKQKVYNSASLMLISSNQEGLGIIGLEAMANGVPVISTSCGGPSDYVIDGQTGFMVPIDDDIAMADRAIFLFSNECIRFVLVKGARKLVREQFSYEVIYHKFKHAMVSVYPELGTPLSQV